MKARSNLLPASEGGEGKPTYGQPHVCWAEDEEAAKTLALKQWPNSALSGSFFLELPLPAHFEEAAEALDEDDVAESIVCGPETPRATARRFRST